MLAGIIASLFGSELALAKRRLRRTLQRTAVTGGLWVCVGLLGFVALICFVAAGHLALRLCMPPIAAWAVTGGGMLLLAGGLALLTVAVDALYRSRR